MNATPMVPISIGELFDKWIILQIKGAHIDDEDKLTNIMTELDALNNIVNPYLYTPEKEKISKLIYGLTKVNEDLWDIEDDIRDLAREGIPKIFAEFFEEDRGLSDKESEKVSRFFELAQLVYITNDKRCVIKNEINKLLGSGWSEEKSYKEY